MDEEKTIQVRDLRNQGWIWTSKAILFDAEIDGNTYKVYAGLSAYANNDTQTAYPSISTLARKLNVSRNTVIKALTALETQGYLGIEKDYGSHNVYSLLETGVKKEKKQKKATPETTPKQTTRDFFVGIADLREKKETDEARYVAAFLAMIKQKYPDAQKTLMWNEVQAFERYWTEKNGTGTKERWQMEQTFEVDRRLATWFARKKEFENKVQITKPTKRIV